jgi:hypothetical protein
MKFVMCWNLTNPCTGGITAEFLPTATLAAPIGSPPEIVVEVPRWSLHQRQSDLVGQGFTEKAIALDIARDVALN